MASSKTSSSLNLGFIGLGAIGLPIAANLNAAGFNLKVHTKSRIAEESLKLKGVKACASPRDTAKGTDVLLICVSNDDAVEAVLFGASGAVETLKENSTIIDLTTISPNTSRSIAHKLEARKITYIDAPVTGGTEGAERGALTIFLGANESICIRLSPILNKIGNRIYAFGKVGKGQEVKALNQVLVAGTYMALAEAIALGQSLDLPMEMVIEALQKGAANSWALQNRSSSMLNNKYPLGFKLSLHHKDLCIALGLAEKQGLDLPVTSKVKQIEERLIEQKYSDEDISALRRYFDP